MSRPPHIEDMYPLSPGQQGMLMVLLLAGTRSELYFDQVTMTLEGDFEPQAWRRAWQAVIDRHPSLRALFLWEKREQPLQVVLRQAELPWSELDWSDLPEAERNERLTAFLAEDRARGFDLSRPPLLRQTLIRWAGGVHKLVWSFHHLIVDGWSLSRVFSEAVALYGAARQGSEAGLEPPRPYRDYIAWVQRQDGVRSEAFWRQALAGLDSPTPLPWDGTGGGAEGASYAQAYAEIPSELAERLAAFARGHRLTLNTLFQGAWGTLLGRTTGTEDVVFGNVVSGRPGEIGGIESVVGFFINVLPVRLRVGAEPLLPALAALQERQIEQRAFEYVPLERIQSWSGLPRGARLVESLLVFQNFPLDPLNQEVLPGFALRDWHVRGATHYPLTLYVGPRGDGGLDLRLDHDASRFAPQAVRQLLASLRLLLESFVERPEARLADLRLLTAGERQQAVAAAAGPAAPPAIAVPAAFAEQARRTPADVALETADGARLTYAELADRAHRLAWHLRSLGVGPESIVGLCLERSPEAIVGMAGILAAGGAYLPLDPAAPRERLAFLLEDTGARAVVTREGLASALPSLDIPLVRLDADAAEIAARPSEPPPVDRLPEQAAYVIYTSGSTGRPKGVVVPHAALANYVADVAREHGIGAGDRVLQFASLVFDTSAEEIWPCLTRGGTLVLRSEEMIGTPAGFLREVERLGLTVLDLPTAYWHEVAAALESEGLEVPAGVRFVIIGGEAAQPARVAAWREHPGAPLLWNTYGPTESTIVATRCDLSAAAGRAVPIGRPVSNVRAHALDAAGEPVADGLDGELWIGGSGLARGYLGRPDLTADRFRPDPFSAAAGERLYRTGDLVRRLPGGDLEFRGRADHQVKIRGFRVELGEIEAALRRLPGVQDAVVLLREDTPGDRRLAAYVVPAGGTAPAASELRAGLRAGLPDYMVPTHFIPLEALPLTSTGKVDRRALPAPGQERPDLEEGFAAPRTPVEEVLAGLWAEILKVDRVGIHDDFFALGGHSLLVAQVVTRVRQALGIELSIVEVFRRPTVAQLAELVEKGVGGASRLPEIPSVRPVPRDGRPLPVSFPQERVWLLDRLTPGGNLAYNFQVTLYFHGPLDVDVLDRTLAELVRRHEVLRTSFPEVDGRPVQVIHPPGPVEMPLVDLRDVPEAEREAMAERLVAETVAVPFDVSRAPLIRWRLLRMSADLHILIQVEHHFVHDGWSYGVLLREVKALYEAFLHGQPSPLPEPVIQYADFAAWQRSWLQGETMERLLEFWRRKLEDRPAPAEIATDRPRPARAAFRGDVEMFAVPPDLYETLRRFSRREGQTLYMTMLAGFFALLQRYTGQDDLLLGTSNANRRAREIEGVIGMVVNTLLLRGDLSGRPAFRALLGRVRELTLEVYAHQDMPFEKLVQDLKPERQLGRNPLFQIMYNFHDAAIPDLDFGGLHVVRRVRGNRSAKVDMNVIMVPRAEQRVGLGASEEDRLAVLHWEYNTDLFDLATMRRMADHYLTLLAGAAADPTRPVAELPMLTEAERHQLQGWAVRREISGEGTLPELFAAQATRTPDAPAVTLGAESLTYRELDRRSDRLARRLRGLGVGPGVPVALCAGRSPALLVGILGILKAGGGYVPLDPAYPAERLGWILEDAQRELETPLLVAERAAAEALPPHRAHLVPLDGPEEAGGDAPLPPLAGPDDLAYVIYTSGSTGRPKGVPIAHRQVVRLFEATRPWFHFGADDVWTLFHSFAFDFSVWEIWGALLHGGRLVVVPAEVSRTPEAFLDLLVRERVTVLNQTPSAFRQLIAAESGGTAEPLALREVIFGGEALEIASLRPWIDRHGDQSPRLVNMYGITETTVHVTYRPLSAADLEQGLAGRIGRPIPDLAVHLVDRDGNLMPLGMPGEILVAGAGLSSGYLHRPELAAERFVPDPFGGEPGARLYRSGDLARWRPDGDLEYLGRIDHQVKIRGFRIELGEIEAALTALPGVREAVVLVREDKGENRLVAWLVVEGHPVGEPLDVPELRRELKRWLPDYMIPAAFVAVESIPLTAHGKLDSKALPEPDAERAGAGSFEAPRTPVEEALARIWSEVLGIERIGVHDDFFALGGHSLSAARVLSRVRDGLGVALPLAAVFELPTLEALAAEIASLATVPREAAPSLAAAPTEVPAHLSDDQLDALLSGLLEERQP